MKGIFIMKRFSYLFLAAMTVIVFAAISSQAALNSYMWIKDETGVDIKGSVTLAGREGSVEVVALDQNVYIPVDPTTNQLIGTRRHDPFVFTKYIDASTTYFNKAVCEGQTFSQVTIRSYQIDNSGAETEYFRCVLEDVKVIKVAPALGSIFNSKKKVAPIEQVSLIYQKITWTYTDGNIQYSDYGIK
jgi:type VI secretion system secreted protein Hcp